MKNILLTLFIVMNLFSSCSNAGDKAPVLSLSEQQIGISSAHNARQLGGYRIGDKTIKSNLLLRSGNLAALNAEDSARLAEVYDLQRIYDFRSKDEATSAPDVIPGKADTLSLSVSFAVANESDKKQIEGVKDERQLIGYLLEYAEDPYLQALCSELYDNILFGASSQAMYRAFFADLVQMDPAQGAVLWHCTQGKDRAGCASALLLAALGAGRDLIMADFALSGAYYDPMVQRIETKTEAQKTVILTLLSVNTTIFEATLDKIDEQYGSLQNYLKECLGVTDDMMLTLQNRYLE